MSSDEFNVWVFLPNGFHYPIAHGLDAKNAVIRAKRAIESYRWPPAERITITDGGDHTCFEWIAGVGITFPLRETTDD